MVARAGLRATINSVVYPISQWEATPGRIIKEEWTQGFNGGMGEFMRSSADGYYMAKNMDAGHSPYLRLRPAFAYSLTGVTNLNELAPVYMFTVYSAAGSGHYHYLLAGRYGFKLSADGQTLHSTKDFGAGAVCGRPALFEGKWYIPLGATVKAVELTTIAATSSADTYTNLDAGGGSAIYALAFALGEKDGVATMWRAATPNLLNATTDISATPAGGDWAAQQFEVGDSTNTITDLLDWNGELAVVKEDNVYAFDQNGNSVPVQTFTQRMPNMALGFSFTAGLNARGAVHGPYLYWPHPMGLWRIVGQQAQPIHPAADPNFTVATRDSFKPWALSAFYSAVGGVAAYGRYLYYGYENKVYYGYIENDGTVRWHGILYSATTAVSVNIVLNPTVSPLLIMTEYTDTIRTIVLEQDGSPHLEIDQTADRGAASEAAQFWLPTVDFGEPQKPKQLRKMWVKAEDLAAASPIQLAVHIDRAESSTNVGSTITAAGMTERSWTPGTTDIAYDVMPTVKITTTGGYSPTNTDPRIVALGVEAATRSQIRARISVTREGLAETGQTITTVQQALRNLIGGAGVTITEPNQGPSQGDSFTGWITGLGEIAKTSDSATGDGWDIDVFIERFDMGS